MGVHVLIYSFFFLVSVSRGACAWTERGEERGSFEMGMTMTRAGGRVGIDALLSIDLLVPPF